MEPGQAQDPRNDAMAQTLPVLAACRQYWCGAREEENAREVSYHRGFAYQNNPDYRKSKEKQLRASLLAIRESERETEGHVFVQMSARSAQMSASQIQMSARHRNLLDGA